MQQFLDECSELCPQDFFFPQVAHSANFDARIFRIYQEVSKEGLQTTRTHVSILKGSIEMEPRRDIS